jgi:dynein intermediate chain
MTFENNDDYIYEAKFHATNPSLFGTVDGLGYLDLWDINLNYESPIFSKEISKGALTKLAWSDDSKRLSVGDSSGKIYIFNLNKCLTNTSADDALKFEKVLAQAKNQRDF